MSVSGSSRLVLSVVLVAVGAVGSSTGAQAQPRQAAVPGLTDSARLSGPVVVEGVLLDQMGKTAPRGEVVKLEAWPAPAALAQLGVGESVKVVPVGYAVTDAMGRFQIRYADRGAADRYAAADGRINLELTAAHAGESSSHSFTAARPSQTPGGAAALGARAGGDKLTAPFVALKAVAPGQPTDRRMAQSMACVTKVVSSFGDKWVTVGASYSGYGVKVDFSYTAGASSELGVGVSASGKAGSFTQKGTSSVSSSSTIDFPTLSGADGRFWKTQFEFKKYRKSCYVPNAPNPKVTYYAKAASYSGGSKSSTPNRPPTANYCTQFEKGTTFTKASTTAWTVSSGVEAGSAIGASLSAKTGYSSDVKIKFVFSETHHLCGTDGKPGGSPKRLVVKH